MPPNGSRNFSPRRKWAWLAAFLVPCLAAVPWIWLWNHSLPSNSMMGTLTGLLLILLVSAITFTDLRWKKIPNWATYPALVFGILLNLVAWRLPSASWTGALGAVGLSQSLAGGLVLFGVMFGIYSIAGGGAGDVKMMAALGVLLGLELGLNAVAYSFILAGAGVLCWALLNRGPLAVARALLRSVGSFLLPLWVDVPSEEDRKLLRSPIRLGPFFAGGVFLVLADVDPTDWIPI